MHACGDDDKHVGSDFSICLSFVPPSAFGGVSEGVNAVRTDPPHPPLIFLLLHFLCVENNGVFVICALKSQVTAAIKRQYLSSMHRFE